MGPSATALLDLRRGRPFWAPNYLRALGVDKGDVSAVKRDLAAARRAEEAAEGRERRRGGEREAAGRGRQRAEGKASAPTVLLYPSHRPSAAFDRAIAADGDGPVVASHTLLLAVGVYVAAVAGVLGWCFREAAGGAAGGRGGKLPLTPAAGLDRT